jgi:hypothetical protein
MRRSPRSQEVTVEANGTGSASVVYATANPNATLEVQNLTAMTVINGQMQLIPGLRHDWISFSVIRSYFQPYHEGMQWHDQSTLRIRNTGTEPMLIETLAFGGVYGWQYEIVDKPELPFAIAAGDHVDLVLQMNFYRNNPSLSHMQNYSKLCPMDNSRVRDRDCGEVRRGTLTIESNAGNARSKVIQLAGAAMWAPETLGWQTDEGWWPHHELSVPQLVDVFGWTIDVEEPISALARNRHGSEVRSQRWRVADSSQPVIVRQLAAYHGCCGRFEATGTRHPDGTSDWHQEDWFDFGSSATRFEHQRLWGQSIFPRLRMGGRGLNSEWQDDRFAERVYSASQLPSTFPIRSTRSQDTTDVDLENGQLGLRMWPVRDHDGVLLPNVWMAVQDNVPPQGECFVDQEDDGMNCDYNDNIYLITNITPVAPIDPVPTN